MDLAHPEALAVLLALPAAWLIWRRGMSDFRRPRRRAALVARSVFLALLTLALTQPRISWPNRRVAVFVLLDQPPGLDDDQRAQAAALVERLKGRAPSGVTVLDRRFGDAAGEGGPAAAIRCGLADLPPDADSRLLLVSDGRQTPGDPEAAAREALALGVPVFTAAVAPPRDRAAVVRSLTAPASAAPRSAIRLTAAIESTHQAQGNLAVYVNGFRIARRSVNLAAGVTTVDLETETPASGFLLFSAQCDLGAEDTPMGTRPAAPNPEPRTPNPFPPAQAITVVRGRPEVLLIEPEDDEDEFLRRALAAEEIAVQARPPTALPSSPVQLNAYDLVILSDVPRAALSDAQLDALHSYVRDLGGAFLMIGGERSFGPGGYARTPVARILPVDVEPPAREELPAIALVLAVDKSGSMNAQQKIELAKAAAQAAAETLAPADQVAVITFDAASYVLAPFQAAGDRSRLTAALAQLTAGGGTSIYPALEDAHRLLAGARTRLKHVILLSDGQSTPADFEALVSRMSAERITVSTVAIGAGADADLLRRIAEWGRGRSYFTANPFNIPQIFTREALTAARRAFVEEPFRPVAVRRPALLRGLDFDQAPMLLGHNLTRRRPTAETVLVGPRGDPVLARWRYGLGQVLAFTADAKNRWAAEWLDTPFYSRFWTQVVRGSLRGEPAGVGAMRAAAVLRGSHATVTLDALDADDRYLNNAQVTARVVGPGVLAADGAEPAVRPEEYRLRQTAPGRYEADIPADTPGAYAVQTFFRPDLAEHPIPHGEPPTAGPACGFLRPNTGGLLLAADGDQLRRIAAAGGGAFLDPMDETSLAPLVAPAGGGRAARRWRPLWPALTAAALALLVVDVFLKRIPLPERGRPARSPR